MMGGEIRVESKEGIGSSFTVTLLMEITRKREIGKSLNRSNILMFSPKSKFVENLHTRACKSWNKFSEPRYR